MIQKLKTLLIILIVHASCLHGEIIFRPATLDDLEKINNLTNHAYETHFRSVYISGYSHMAWGQNPDSFIKEKIAGGHATAKDFLIRSANKEEYAAIAAYEIEKGKPDLLQGVCFFNKKDPETIHIRFLFVNEACRGKGIGKKLILMALETFENTTKCTLNTLAHANDATHAFYERLGFVNTGIVTINPAYPDTHHGYVLDLSGSNKLAEAA